MAWTLAVTGVVEERKWLQTNAISGLAPLFSGLGGKSIMCNTKEKVLAFLHRTQESVGTTTTHNNVERLERFKSIGIQWHKKYILTTEKVTKT